jgi:hypothetical protein
MICPSNITGDNPDLSKLGIDKFNNYKFRHTSKNYKGNSKVSNEILMEYIKEGVNETISKNKKHLLMLSDGKDSLSLAIALSELGIKCHTLTLLRRSDDQMKSYLTDICEKLGHTPFFVSVDEIVDNLDVQLYLDSFKEMKTPVLDQGYIFFLFGMHQFFKKYKFCASDYEIIDGLGNDEYLGYMMSKSQWWSFKLSKLGFWKLLPNAMKNLKWFLRSPAESNGDLSTLACFFNLSSAYDLNTYFSKIPSSTEPLTYLDFRSFSRGAFHDHQCMMGKTVVSARYLGSNAVFPWLEENLSNFCFNIPLVEKLNFEELTNKIPLRILLKEKLNWEQEKRGVDLFVDLDLNTFKEKILSKMVPEDLSNKILNNQLLGTNIKKRACLELANFYGFCLNNGFNESEIRSILIEK